MSEGGQPSLVIPLVRQSKRGINTLALVEELASQRGGKREEHDASNLNVCMKGAATAPVRLSGGCEEGQLENWARNGGESILQSVYSLTLLTQCKF